MATRVPSERSVRACQQDCLAVSAEYGGGDLPTERGEPLRPIAVVKPS